MVSKSVLSEQEDRGKSPRPWWRKKEKGLLAMNEFQLTLINILQRRGMSVADLAEQTGYTSLFFENIVTGKDRQIPVSKGPGCEPGPS